jgi:hypothetical protein
MNVSHDELSNSYLPSRFSCMTFASYYLLTQCSCGKFMKNIRSVVMLNIFYSLYYFSVRVSSLKLVIHQYLEFLQRKIIHNAVDFRVLEFFMVMLM